MTRPTRGAYRLSESVSPGTTSGGSWIMVVHGVDRGHIVPVNELRSYQESEAICRSVKKTNSTV